MNFSGLMAATLTPFDSIDRLNVKVIAPHINFLIAGGVQGLCPAGTTGEMLYLSIGEKVRLIEETISAAKGRVPVVAGIWALREKEVALLARAAQTAGADAVFLPPPIYYPANDDAIFGWYGGVKSATDLPIFAYNIPGYAANAISEACIERLVSENIIAGIKDSTGKPEQMSMLVEKFGSRVAVEAASDAFVTGARKIGAVGFISALANVAPALVRAVWDGDESRQVEIDAIRNAVKRSGGIAAIKYLVGRKGFDFGVSRVPGSGLSESSKDILDNMQIS